MRNEMTNVTIDEHYLAMTEKRHLSKKFEFLSEDGTTIFLKRIEQERKIVES